MASIILFLLQGNLFPCTKLTKSNVNASQQTDVVKYTCFFLKKIKSEISTLNKSNKYNLPNIIYVLNWTILEISTQMLQISKADSKDNWQNQKPI